MRKNAPPDRKNPTDFPLAVAECSDNGSDASQLCTLTEVYHQALKTINLPD